MDWASVPVLRTPILPRSEEHTSELQSRLHLVCRLLLEKKNIYTRATRIWTVSVLTPSYPFIQALALRHIIVLTTLLCTGFLALVSCLLCRITSRRATSS